MQELMNGLVEFREGNKSKRARRIEIIIKRNGAAALRGDIGAAEMLLRIRANFVGNRAIQPIIIEMTEAEMRAA